MSDLGAKTQSRQFLATARAETRNLRPKGRLRQFQEIIAWWLHELGLIDGFRVQEIAPGASLYRAYVKKDAKFPETLITDVGFGISQILPALVLLYYVPEGATVILEQPEIHLHPAVQSALADLIITVVKSRRVQVILESHSEHLLQRLLRRVAEGNKSPHMEIQPEDMRLYFCHAKFGESKLRRLDVNLFGGIENWPDDFFGDSFGDIAAREEAALSRRLSSAKRKR